MMKIKIAILFFLLLPIYSISQIDHSEYLEKCDAEFNTLLKSVSKSKQDKWNNKFNNINQEFIRISNEARKDESIYKKLGAQHIYATQYLNSINDYLLPSKTNITNSIAEEVVNDAIGIIVTKKIDSLNRVFEIYANTDKAINFEKTYNRFLLTREKNKTINEKIDTLFFTLYEFKNNVYSEPYKVNRYVIFDWAEREKKLTKLKKELDNISNDIKVKQFIIIKDPNPIIPLLFQFCTLLVVISGIVINFKFEKKLHKTVLLLVFSSLFTAILLLFLSDNTILNTAINILVPGCGYLIFYYNKKEVKNDKTQ